MVHSYPIHAEKRTRKISHHQTQSDTAPWGWHELCILPTVGEITCASRPVIFWTHPPQLWGQTRLQSPQCSSTKDTFIQLYPIHSTECNYLQQWRQCLLWQEHFLSIDIMAPERLGMPQTASASMLATIQGMKFFIHTYHGVSHDFFTSTLSALILGVLQGSGAVPCIWLNICCILHHALKNHTTGFQVICPHYSKTSKHPG